MSSPGIRHKQRVLALQGVAKAAATGQATGLVANSLHLQLIALEEDMKRLKSLVRRGDKVAMKRDELFPKYRPYVDKYLELAALGTVYQNELFQRLIIWAFDIDDLETGITWALLAIEQNQRTPSNIKRDWAHFTADTVLVWAEEQAALGHGVEPWFSRVFDKVRGDWRLNEQATAKWYRLAGHLLLRDKDGKPRPSALADSAALEQADHWLALAEKTHSKIGVGTLRHKIAMRLRALNPA
ncbi:terminase [Aeromonas veronii]|uniref:Terminase n=1 Tax=Aeromonas veronii TaxID=654 RepID=A0A3A9IL60_AERVE|nr:phage terminase small subunit [Aeromonas veronii]RKJ83784.1 terminase [Aeromonas veronii]RKJ84391.1 terminase [Aeromonas veronii]RKJ89949.1 terminase [Aeromonas veronii]RKJ92177.1 terminase [Aeromonas veronii]